MHSHLKLFSMQSREACNRISFALHANISQMVILAMQQCSHSQILFEFFTITRYLSFGYEFMERIWCKMDAEISGLDQRFRGIQNYFSFMFYFLKREIMKVKSGKSISNGIFHTTLVWKSISRTEFKNFAILSLEGFL